VELHALETGAAVGVIAIQATTQEAHDDGITSGRTAHFASRVAPQIV
jgi:hypothetical protein